VNLETYRVDGVTSDKDDAQTTEETIKDERKLTGLCHRVYSIESSEAEMVRSEDQKMEFSRHDKKP
jgi:hypothetical protein